MRQAPSRRYHPTPMPITYAVPQFIHACPMGANADSPVATSTPTLNRRWSSLLYLGLSSTMPDRIDKTVIYASGQHIIRA